MWSATLSVQDLVVSQDARIKLSCKNIQDKQGQAGHFSWESKPVLISLSLAVDLLSYLLGPAVPLRTEVTENQEGDTQRAPAEHGSVVQMQKGVQQGRIKAQDL